MIQLLFILTAVAALFFQAFKIHKSNKVTIVDYSNIWFVVVYFVVPAYLHVVGKGFNPLYDSGTEYINGYEFYAFFICFLAYAGFLAGVKMSSTSRLIIKGTVNKETSIRIVIGLFLISCVSFLFFIYEYGGLEYVLGHISKIRSGVDENKSYLGAFVRMFTYYLDVAFYTFLAVLAINYKKSYKYIFIFLFMIIIFKALLSGGRQNFINIFIGFLFLTTIKEIKIGFFKPVFIFLLSLFIIFFGKSFLFQLFTTKDVFNLFTLALNNVSPSYLVSHLSHQYLAVHDVLNNELGVRRFSDFYLWILKPFKLFGFRVEDSISYFHTYNISGVWESTVPPGLIALLLYQSGFIFTFFGCFVLGYICGAFEKATLEYRARSAVLFGFYVVFSLYYPTLITMADPALVFQNTLVFQILFFVYLFTGKIKFAWRSFY